ncbi:MAG: MgtC/SapB family protein [Verrucomicrobiae bacterium]|nr:MgtC/SapB family protein [Verrucomicrobiae bacterium]
MNTTLSLEETLARLLAAALAGAIVGWERESHGRPAGLRTTILAGAASAVAMMLSHALFLESAAETAWRPDPARLGAGILTGIGFLGAGTIIRHENLVRGVTTAASLWFVTVLGLVFGSGEFALGCLGLIVAVLALYALPAMEKHIRSDWYATLTLTTELDALSEGELRQRLQAQGLSVRATEFRHDFVARRKTIGFELKLKRDAAFDVSTRLLAEARHWPGVLEVTWR